MDSISGSERSPGGGHGNPLQYSCLENHVDIGVWQVTSPQGRKELDMTKATLSTSRDRSQKIDPSHPSPLQWLVLRLSNSTCRRYTMWLGHTGPPHLVLLFLLPCLISMFPSLLLPWGCASQGRLSSLPRLPFDVVLG